MKQPPASRSWRRALGASLLTVAAALPVPSAAAAPSDPPLPIAWEVVFEDGFEAGLRQ